MSEDAPYYDDDFLMDHEELGYNHLRDISENSSTHDNDKRNALNIESGRSVDDEEFVIRDDNGVALGWSDWNENEDSYFDEDRADDEELTFGEKLVLERKEKEDTSVGSSGSIASLNVNALINKGLKSKQKSEKFEIPKFEGEISGEFEDW